MHAPPTTARPAPAPLLRVRAIAVLGALGVAALGSGCEPDPEEQAIRDALEETVTALRDGDWPALWALTAPDAKDELVALHRGVHRALEVIPTVYPDADRAAAYAAVGRDLVEGVPAGASPDEVGTALLPRLFVSSAVRTDEAAFDGIRTGRPVIDVVGTATVHTPAGEVFTFTRTDAGWRSRLLWDVLSQNGRGALLREHVEAVLKAHDAWGEAWRRGRDPGTSHGAFNALREAVHADPANAEVVHALIGPGGRAVLAEALDVARAAQKAIQKRTPKKEREAAYAEAGISTHVAADSDVALLAAWLQTRPSPPLVPDLLPTRAEPTEQRTDEARAGGGAAAPTDDATGQPEPPMATEWHRVSLESPGGAGAAPTVTMAKYASRWEADDEGLTETLRAALLVPANAALAAATAPTAEAPTTE